MHNVVCEWCDALYIRMGYERTFVAHDANSVSPAQWRPALIVQSVTVIVTLLARCAEMLQETSQPTASIDRHLCIVSRYRSVV